MRAIEYFNYGTTSVFQLNNIAKPSPGPKEILIRVYATTVTAADLMMREGKPYIGRLFIGLKKPKHSTLGFDFAGEVVDTGEQVTLFKKGDRVFGGTTSLGCYAEYKCLNEEDVISIIPENSTYEQAAPIAGSAITAIHFLKSLANIQEGQKVLINGASGAVGTYAVQYAKHIGAEVTGVCSTINLDMVRSLGADKVIDYTQTDFISNSEKYDIIFDTVAKRTFSECKNSLTKNGIYLSTVINFQLLSQMIWSSFSGSKKVRTTSTGMLSAKVRTQYLFELKELLEKGKIKSVIHSHLPLSQISEAHRYVEEGHKKGNIIIDI